MNHLITARQLKARYGFKSDMWIWRQLHRDETFPKPLYINRRRHWKLADLLAWEKAQPSSL